MGVEKSPDLPTIELLMGLSTIITKQEIPTIVSISLTLKYIT